MSIIQFLSAFGLGALVTAIVQAWLARRAEMSKRTFHEKKESYIGFLDAVHKSDTQNTEEAALYVGHWKARIELVGSPDVIHLCNRFQETNPINNTVHPDRPQVFQDLKNAMRKDLGVAV
jgi:hypothetical protein